MIKTKLHETKILIMSRGRQTSTTSCMHSYRAAVTEISSEHINSSLDQFLPQHHRTCTQPLQNPKWFSSLLSSFRYWQQLGRGSQLLHRTVQVRKGKLLQYNSTDLQICV